MNHRDDYRPPRDAIRRLWAERILMAIGAAIVLAPAVYAVAFLVSLFGGRVVR